MKRLNDRARGFAEFKLKGKDTFMDMLVKTIPDDVKNKIAGRMAIDAGVATGPSFMIFKGEDFDPPVSIEAGLNWIESTMKDFKGAHLKLDNFTVLWFSGDTFSRYDEKKKKRPIRPTCTVSGHKIDPFEPAGKKKLRAIQCL